MTTSEDTAAMKSCRRPNTKANPPFEVPDHCVLAAASYNPSLLALCFCHPSESAILEGLATSHQLILWLQAQQTGQGQLAASLVSEAIALLACKNT